MIRKSGNFVNPAQTFECEYGSVYVCVSKSVGRVAISRPFAVSCSSQARPAAICLTHMLTRFPVHFQYFYCTHLHLYGFLLIHCLTKSHAVFA